MAYYENLPVYKKAMELTVYIEKIVRKFSRYHKYTIGSELRNLSRSLGSLIIRANSVREKLLLLTELRDRSEEMKPLIVIKNNDLFSFMSLYNAYIACRKRKRGTINALNFEKGHPGLLEKVPRHKTLFYTPKHKGLPIGNLTSQFFANVYLNELDQYVKHTLKVRYYIRYVDDLILLDRSKERLLRIRDDIGRFLKQKIDLEFREEQGECLKRVSSGADFLGYIVRPGYVLVRRRVAGNLKSRLSLFSDKIVVRGAIAANRYIKIYIRKPALELRQVLASYLGHFKHANACTLTKNLFERYIYLKYLFLFDRRYKLTLLYETPFAPSNLRRQYRWYVNRYKGFSIFFHVGRFFEFYGEQAELAFKRFGIKPCKEARGYGQTVRYSCAPSESLQKRGPSYGFPYIVIGERGGLIHQV